ncbi:hypothetical protein NBRC116493_08690 [Aurantivibrio infirmus]
MTLHKFAHVRKLFRSPNNTDVKLSKIYVGDKQLLAANFKHYHPTLVTSNFEVDASIRNDRILGKIDK